LTAVAAFEARYRLAELARAAEQEWRAMDFALLPTAGNCYTHEQIAADPVGRNTDLGYYTNFVNLLDLAAVAVPAGMRTSAMPFGVTVMAPAWSDAALLSIAGRLHQTYMSPPAQAPVAPPYCPDGYIALAVCGAHLSGQPLNWELTEAGAFLIEETRTAAGYRLYALHNTTPAKPGLFFDATGGAPISVEVWAVPEQRFGRFTAAVPPPLGIGTCTLESGREVKSFICEPRALAAAEDITSFGGWRNWLSSR
jgi:allophanate hydrolase